MTLSEASTVLPLFVRALGGSNLMAGLVPSLRWAGWLVPQFLAAGRMRHLPRFLPLIRVLEIVRSVGYLLIAGIALGLGRDHGQWVLVAFVPIFVATRFAAGSSAVARNEVIARIVPPDRRPAVVSLRQFAGGIAGFIAGLVVRYVLDEGVTTFPYNYALLIGLSGILFGIAIAVLSRVVEDERPRSPAEIGIGAQLRRAPRLLRDDPRYATYVAMCAAASGMTLATPFFALYAIDALHAAPSMAGIYISARTLARVLSNLWWGRQCRERGSLSVLRAGYALALLAPLAVVALSVALPSAAGGSVAPHLSWLFAGVFVIQGLAASATGVGQVAYLYEIAPDTERSTYYGLTNTILGPLHFLPALGGALLDTVGYVPVFALASAMMATATAIASRAGARAVAHTASGLPSSPSDIAG